MQTTQRWTGTEDFLEAQLSVEQIPLCCLTVERYEINPGKADTWEWRIWPVMWLRQGEEHDRRGVSLSRAAAKRAAFSAAEALRPTLATMLARKVCAMPFASARRYVAAGS